MYTQKTFDLNGNIIEQEIHCAGKYGCKGEKRVKRRKRTPQEMERQNQTNKVINVRRVMRANFTQGDIFCTLKNPKGIRKTAKELKKDWKQFRIKVGRYYKANNVPFKWINRMEIGEQGGCHIHILLNRIPGKDTDVVIQEIWNGITGGRVNFQPAYLEGGFEQLAAYMAKKPSKAEQPKEYRQLSLLPEEERKVFLKYSSSKNLKRPVPTVKKFSHWTLKRLLKDGVENIKPTPGYYIDRDSIVHGVNPFTGMTYLYYTEYALKTRQSRINTSPEWQYG